MAETLKFAPPPERLAALIRERVSDLVAMLPAGVLVELRADHEPRCDAGWGGGCRCEPEATAGVVHVALEGLPPAMVPAGPRPASRAVGDEELPF